MIWTEEAKDRIAGMWGDGRTASQIAAEIGGVSRNAVVGVVHRDKRLKAIGFKRSPGQLNDGKAQKLSISARRRRGEVRGGHVSRNRLKVAPVPPIVELMDGDPGLPEWFGAPHVAGVTMMMLTEHRCKWPINDGGPFLFCGCEADFDRPYCDFHTELAKGKGTESERSAERVALKAAA